MLIGLITAFVVSALGVVFTFKRAYVNNEDVNLRVAITCGFFCILTLFIATCEVFAD
jgi:uncharacterized membrane protein